MIRTSSFIFVLGLVVGCAGTQGGSRVAHPPAGAEIAVESGDVEPSEPLAGLDARDHQPATPISVRRPEYPSWDKLEQAETEVVVRYAVLEDGSVRTISASGPDAFRKKALEAVESWKFKPATQAGRAVLTRRATRFVFRVKA